MDPANNITCDGDLPSFPLPPPYLVSDFQSPQELCAVQWAGGLSGANVGGYCRRSDPRGALSDYGYENNVWFSDEMTPRYEYTWGGGSLFLAASLRTYCYARCWCSSVGKEKTSRNRLCRCGSSSVVISSYLEVTAVWTTENEDPYRMGSFRS